MKLRSLALAALAFGPAFAAAHAATLDGTWYVTGSVQDNPVNPVCVLVEKDAKITGTCTGTDGKLNPVTGTVTGEKYKFQYDSTYQGGGITIALTGSLDKDGKLAGTIYVEPYAVDGGFTATKDKPTAPVKPPAA